MDVNINQADPPEEEADSIGKMTTALWKRWARYSLGFDLRSLAFLRIVACSLYLCELLRNWKYLEAFYTDAGMLPRNLLFEGVGGNWSLYLAVSSLPAVKTIYCVQIATVGCLILGWRTRWASLACYVLTMSLQNRFPALPGWETEIRVLFLVGFFLPWGEWWSWDARRKCTTERPTFAVTAATAAWRVQIVVLYLASGLLKGGPGWADGTAVEVSLASDGYSNAWGLALLAHCQHYPQSLVVLNFAIPLLEIFTPLFLMSPWPRIQMAWVFVLFALHGGFGLCLNIGMFSPICCACLLGFLPSEFWNRIHRGYEVGVLLKSEPPIGETVFLTWVCFSIILSAADSLPESKDFVQPTALRPWKALGIDQHWGMFVPPPFEGGWHVIKGKTLDGKWVNLMRGDRNVTDEKPEQVSSLYAGVRGYLYLGAYLRTQEPDNKYLREAIAAYYVHAWENSHASAQDRISQVEVVFFKRVYVPGHGFKEPERLLLYSHQYSGQIFEAESFSEKK